MAPFFYDFAVPTKQALADLRTSLDALGRHADAIAYNLEATTRNMSEFSGQIRNDPSALLLGRGDAATGADP